MVKILIYNQYFFLGISGVDHLRLSTIHEHSAMWPNWPFWLNILVFINELNGCGFESRCNH